MSHVKSIADIMHERLDKIRGHLTCISNDIEVKMSSSRGNILCTAYSQPWKGVASFEEMRFNTIHDNIIGFYNEIWKRQEEDRYVLDRIYLHLHDANDLKEIMCMHSEPNTPKSDPKYDLQVGPHLHFKRRFKSLPHMHVSLSLKDVLENSMNISDLDESFRRSIAMINGELVDYPYISD